MSMGRKEEIAAIRNQGGICYISAVVLGLNDALVELTGALAGFTMGLENSRLIILAGLTTGIAATLSMAASEFFSQKADARSSQPLSAAMFTGMAYLITVIILLLPFCLISRPMAALGVCLLCGASIITCFTYVESRMRKISFLRTWLQMLCVSFGVAAISFFISWLAKNWWGISI